MKKNKTVSLDKLETKYYGKKGTNKREKYDNYVSKEIKKQSKSTVIKYDPINPKHYGGSDNPYEAIKVIEAWEANFCIGNALKYLSRAGKKGNEIEDLKKAIWYINREITNIALDAIKNKNYDIKCYETNYINGKLSSVDKIK